MPQLLPLPSGATGADGMDRPDGASGAIGASGANGPGGPNNANRANAAGTGFQGAAAGAGGGTGPRRHGHHPVLIGAPRGIRAPAGPGRGSAPALLQRSDDDFITATVEQLRDRSGQAALRALQAQVRTPRQVLKLYQPVQRQFHLLLLEAWCDTPGAPRLDPARVDSAGFVLRRLRRDAQGSWLEGWMGIRGQTQGWVRISRLGADLADPSPQHRLAAPEPARSLGRHLDAALRQQALARPDALLQEREHPLFPAPPDVCADAGQSLYYGIVPTTSSDIAAIPAPERDSFGDDFGPDSAAFINHLVEPLRGDASDFPLAGDNLQAAWLDALREPIGARPDSINNSHWSVLGTPVGQARLQRLVTLLRQLVGEFDALGSGPASSSLMAQLQAINLPLLRRGNEAQRSTDAASFVRGAARVLLLREPGAPAVEMPLAWPALPDAQRRALRAALSQALRARFAAVKGAPGRFDEPGAQYLLQPFLRLKAEAGCPPRTVWGDATEPFVIAAWYEGSGAPPVQIAMPDPAAPGFLASLKPTVSFVVPPSLQSLLGGNPKDLLDGKGSLGGGTTLGWICSFNLPIITICAFIVLNIFLSLFDLFLRWLMFIKICIPFPKRSDGDG